MKTPPGVIIVSAPFSMNLTWAFKYAGYIPTIRKFNSPEVKTIIHKQINPSTGRVTVEVIRINKTSYAGKLYVQVQSIQTDGAFYGYRLLPYKPCQVIIITTWQQITYEVNSSEIPWPIWTPDISHYLWLALGPKRKGEVNKKICVLGWVKEKFAAKRLGKNIFNWIILIRRIFDISKKTIISNP